jgi:polysaccharide export outer membrane protein
MSARRLVLVACMAMAACAPRHPHVPAAAAGPAELTAADEARIAALVQARAGGGDYCLGAGDLVSITVFGWDAMRDQQTRVSATGQVSLPMIGSVPAAGRTESELRDELERRLRNGFMRDPHVTVFVQRFQSQQVSVTGAVARPGLYSLTRESRTVYDLLSQAGGMTEQAGGRVVFSPATEIRCAGVGSPTPPPASGVKPAAMSTALAPIEFELDAPVGAGQVNPMTIPVVGGDSIVVSRGRFMVDGWVAKPGLYAFSPGMTAHGAMTVAGGALFPANLHEAQIIRAKRDGTKEVIDVDLVEVEHGDARDVALREGDVIRLNASTAKMVPYSVYWMFTNLFRVGAGISVAGI